MQAIQVTEYGGLDALQLVDLSMPEATGAQVLVQNMATGVNFVDIQHREGGYYYPRPLPLIPGIEAAGVIVAVGDAVEGFAVGNRVVYAGHYADYMVMDYRGLTHLPDDIGYETAAAAMLQGTTAYILSHVVHPIQAGETILIHAAAGGVGMMLVQMSKHAGAIVIGTVSSAEKADFVAQLGVDHVIRYTEQDFLTETLAITGGSGVNVVYDAIGKTTFEGSLNSLAKRGHLVIYGQTSGAPPLFDINRLSGITLGSTRGSNRITWAAASDYTENPASISCERV